MKKLATLLITALLLSAMFHQDLILKHIFTPENRVTAPLQSSSVQLGDHYYYYILSMKSSDRLLANMNLKEENTFQSKNSGLENVFAGALLTAGVIDAFAKLLPLPWNIEVTISLVLQTSILFFCLLVFYKLINFRREVPILEYFMFGFLWALASYGVIRGIYIGSFSYIFTSNPFPGYPDFLRTVNPQLGWAAGILYISVLYKFYSTENTRHLPICIGMSLIMGFFSISITATMLLGLGLFGLVRLVQNKTLDYQLVIIGLSLLISFFSVYYLMIEFRATEKGLSLNTGSFNELSFKWHFLYLATVIPLIYLLFDSKTRWLLISLYTGALLIGLTCNSFELGSRIWLRGAGFITLSVLILITFRLLAWVNKPIRFNSGDKMKVATIVVPVACTYLIYLLMPLNQKDWHYNMQQSKAEVITWIKENTKPNSYVASEDLQDAYYLPIYTDVTPFVQLYDYSTVKHQTLLENYLLVMKVLKKETELLQRLSEFELSKRRDHLKYVLGSSSLRQDYEFYQTYAFFSGLLYYPYTSEFKNIFSNQDHKAKLLNQLKAIIETIDIARIQRVDYLIKLNDLSSNSIDGFEVVYSNSDFEILKSASIK